MSDIADRLRAMADTGNCFGLDSVSKECLAGANEITRLRALLDSTPIADRPMFVVDPGAIDLDDLMQITPGKILYISGKDYTAQDLRNSFNAGVEAAAKLVDERYDDQEP